MLINIRPPRRLLTDATNKLDFHSLSAITQNRVIAFLNTGILTMRGDAAELTTLLHEHFELPLLVVTNLFTLKTYHAHIRLIAHGTPIKWNSSPTKYLQLSFTIATSSAVKTYTHAHDWWAVHAPRTSLTFKNIRKLYANLWDNSTYRPEDDSRRQALITRLLTETKR